MSANDWHLLSLSRNRHSRGFQAQPNDLPLYSLCLTRWDILVIPSGCIKSYKHTIPRLFLFASAVATIWHFDITINNNQFHLYIDSIYPNELEIKGTAECATSASYLNILLKLDSNGKLTTRLYDKRNDFNFSIINVPYLCSNIPFSPAYVVYISQQIRYARDCLTYNQFTILGNLQKNKLMSQRFLQSRSQSAFRKFYGCCNSSVDWCIVLANLLTW
jgi:hypothetical protein